MQNTFMNLAHFLAEVNALFGASVPTSEEVRLRLVPTGTVNNASPGQFGPDGIYKYEFNLACGTSVAVKCHKRQPNAKGGPTCNAARFATAQLYIYGVGGVTHHVVWDNHHKNATHVSAVDLWNDDQLINWSHIPVQWNSTPVRGQPST